MLRLTRWGLALGISFDNSQTLARKAPPSRSSELD
jgi:hypothetical protein